MFNFRSAEDLILDTLMIKMSLTTGIPTGLIDVKMPDVEFVNKIDGTKIAPNVIQFPSLGFTYYADPIIGYNSNGKLRLINTSATGVTEYDPLGSIKLFIAINLFTKTRYDQNNIGNNIMMALQSNAFYTFLNDVFSDQYFSVTFKKFKDMATHQPYHKVFMIECCAETLRQFSGVPVSEIDLALNPMFRVVNGSIITAASGTVQNVRFVDRPKNPGLIINHFDFQGIEERVVDVVAPSTDNAIIMYETPD